jgi:hypothetical protein
VPWVAVGNAEDPLDLAANPRFERVTDVSGFSSQLSGQAELSEDLGLRSWGYVNRQVEYHKRYDDADLDSMNRSGSFDLKGTALATGCAVHGRYDLDRLGVLRFAGNGRYESFDSLGRIREGGGGGGGGGGAGVLRRVDQQNSLGVWSLGLEHELPWRATASTTTAASSSPAPTTTSPPGRGCAARRRIGCASRRSASSTIPTAAIRISTRSAAGASSSASPSACPGTRPSA